MRTLSHYERTQTLHVVVSVVSGELCDTIKVTVECTQRPVLRATSCAAWQACHQPDKIEPTLLCQPAPTSLEPVRSTESSTYAGYARSFRDSPL